MMAKTSLPPGFRFHPTDVELVWYYLKRKIMGKPFRFDAVSEIELYKFAPWDLPDKSCLRSRDLEWYFFCPRDRKYANGSRTNRATDIGYWKMTGRDRPVVHNSRTVGMKKTLVFHLGKPPQGTRTDWVMYEFRLEDKELVNAGYSQDAYVLCKIFQKSGPGPKNGEQYGAPFKEEDWEDDTDIEHAVSYVSFPEPVDSHALLLEPVQQQSVASEVGEPSSSMPDLSEVGEPSSMPDPSYADGILLEQLEEYLYCSPPHLENANVEMLNPEIQHEDVNEMPDGDIEGIYRELDDLSAQLGLEPIDDVHFSDTMYCDYTLHQFAEEHYVELSDLSFPSENDPFELVVPDGTHYPFAIHPSSQGLNSIYVDSVVSTSMVNHLLSMGTDITNDQLPSTSKVPSPPRLFSQQKDHVP